MVLSDVVFKLSHGGTKPGDEVYVSIRRFDCTKTEHLDLTTDTTTFPTWSSKEHRLALPLMYKYHLRDKNQNSYEEVGSHRILEDGHGRIETDDQWQGGYHGSNVYHCSGGICLPRRVVHECARKGPDFELQLQECNTQRKDYVGPEYLAQRIDVVVEEKVKEHVRKAKMDLTNEHRELLNFGSSADKKFAFTEKVNKIERDLEDLRHDFAVRREAENRNEGNNAQTMLTSLEKTVSDMQEDFHTLEIKIEELDKRIAGKIGQLEKRMAELPKEVETNMVGVTTIASLAPQNSGFPCAASRKGNCCEDFYQFGCYFKSPLLATQSHAQALEEKLQAEIGQCRDAGKCHMSEMQKRIDRVEQRVLDEMKEWKEHMSQQLTQKVSKVDARRDFTKMLHDIEDIRDRIGRRPVVQGAANSNMVPQRLHQPGIEDEMWCRHANIVQHKSNHAAELFMEGAMAQIQKLQDQVNELRTGNPIQATAPSKDYAAVSDVADLKHALQTDRTNAMEAIKALNLALRSLRDEVNDLREKCFHSKTMHFMDTNLDLKSELSNLNREINDLQDKVKQSHAKSVEAKLQAEILQLRTEITSELCNLQTDLRSHTLRARDAISCLEANMDMHNGCGQQAVARVASRSPARITRSRNSQRADFRQRVGVEADEQAFLAQRKPHFSKPEHPTHPESRALTLAMEQEILSAINKSPEDKRKLVKRKLPKDAHPDSGGTHEAFQWLDDWTKEYLDWYMGPGHLPQ